eukprot:CAMPEP_0181032390 /NCGR_PEP_ID=MMETSP1070-20121207/6717_1 /TAXON_ID=265543 /ORGANISM="Minutocellus polymorphus, Strain NH13" /LENGTH=263 /DNA_ID=CAMNT_0023109785 /DNA_START=372 /DNA_END=1159 /DNA_ORIENTATION=-
MNSQASTRPSSDGRNDVAEDHELTESFGRHTTIATTDTSTRYSLASHRDSIQGKHHRRLPTGSYTKKGIKRRDDKRRGSVSEPRLSRSQLYNSFVTSNGVDDDFRDPFHDDGHDFLANIEEDSYGRFIQERCDGSRFTTRSVKGLRQSKQPKQQRQHRRQTSSSTRASRESSTAGREGTSSLKKSVSFVDGDAVTVVNHNALYSEEEKVACFYTDRDFRRFRAEHYLGVVYVESEDDSPEKAAQDLLHVVGDMWNSLLDMTFS